jgi:hypothetical protein
MKGRFHMSIWRASYLRGADPDRRLRAPLAAAEIDGGVSDLRTTAAISSSTAFGVL